MPLYRLVDADLDELLERPVLLGFGLQLNVRLFGNQQADLRQFILVHV